MYNIISEGYRLNETREGKIFDFVFHTTYKEYNDKLIVDDKDGMEYPLPEVGDKYFDQERFPNAVLTSRNARPIPGSYERDPDTGLLRKTTLNEVSIVDESYGIWEITLTYSDVKARMDKIRKNQASSWWIQWHTSLDDIEQEVYYKLSNPASGYGSSGAWQIWATDYFTANAADIKTKYGLTDEQIEELKLNGNYPKIKQKIPNIFVTFHVYTNQLRGQQFATHMGYINSTGLIDWTYEKRRAAAQVLQRPGFYSAEGSDIGVGGTWNDIGKWLSIDFNIEEKSFGIFHYSATFMFKSDGWNTQYGITTNTYPTYDFRLFFEGCAQTEPLFDEDGTLIE
jgi:hypothetical protein